MAQQNKLTPEDIERIDALLDMRNKVKTLRQIGVIKANPVKSNTDNRIKSE